MSTFADRLRDVIRPTTPALRGAGPRPDVAGGDVQTLAVETLGGEWRETQSQRYMVVERRFTIGYRHGHVAVADALPPWPLLSLAGGLPAAPPGPERMLFLDLETTGLAGGAGTYAFLVGCAWFDAPSSAASPGQAACFRTRQYFLSSYAAERALLEQVAADVADTDVVITYNGKSFDLPLLDTRYVLHRLQGPFAGRPHVDMLHTARRLWRSDEDEGDAAGCRLTRLEETLWGRWREGDVPGFEIPSRYFHFVRTGDARPLDAVLEHNRLDLLSLALVTARAAQMLEQGPGAARTAREALGLGQLYERTGWTAEATACYERAGSLPGDVTSHAEALRACARLARRARRYHEAASAWRRLLELRRCPPALAREAAEALAVYHEHRARDLREARRFAVQSLQFNATAALEQAGRHRLTRLERKLGGLIADG